MPSIVAIQNGVAITVSDIVTGDGIAVVQFNGKANGRTGMPTTMSTYTYSAIETTRSAVLPSFSTPTYFTNYWNNNSFAQV